MKYSYFQVKDFHKSFNHPVSEIPVLLDKKRAVTRKKWMVEELDEFEEATTIEDQADAMIDLMYFALGTLVEMGVEPEVIFDIVHEANMNKLFEDGKPRYGEDGKCIKPENWQDPLPQIQVEIVNQENKVENYFKKRDDLMNTAISEVKDNLDDDFIAGLIKSYKEMFETLDSSGKQYMEDLIEGYLSIGDKMGIFTSNESELNHILSIHKGLRGEKICFEKKCKADDKSCEVDDMDSLTIHPINDIQCKADGVVDIVVNIRFIGIALLARED